MIDLTHLVARFYRFGHTNIRILMVVDSSIRTVEAPGAFGIGRVVRLIDNYSRGCSSFSVDTARREPFVGDNSQNQGHISTDFRFNDLDGDGNRIIDSYDQIWMFGFRGEGSGPVVSAAELGQLTDWMNKGGGVFATGDHDDLGASMCSGIPRVREMRRWTASQQVPPIGGFNRLDTNRPTNTAEATGASPIAFAHERDTTPQPIEWVPVSVQHVGVFSYEFPHETLCHPALGPIDVMPDHPHEGRTREVSEMNTTRTYNFTGGISGDDFPSSGGHRPLPQVIAYGETAPAPPTNKPYKGNCGYFRFPMISVYDGRDAGVQGRVATDSTWHHWFDLNIYELEHAADDTAWRKIACYFQNLAVWLSPPGRFREKCWFIHQWLEYPLVEELDIRNFDVRRINPDLGVIVRDRFRQVFGPCATRRFAWDNLCELAPRICRGLERFEPRFPPFPDGPIPDPICLTCPPPEIIENAIFEGVMLSTIEFMQKHVDRAEELAKLSDVRLERELNRFMAPGVHAAVQGLGKRILKDLDKDQRMWAKVVDARPGGRRRPRRR
ncbi:MAG: hypothetical protein QNJ40_02495 [Xanthomonadales bacterium]|nr:hypothetical protein [Xanthomonadales bacterium]